MNGQMKIEAGSISSWIFIVTLAFLGAVAFAAVLTLAFVLALVLVFALVVAVVATFVVVLAVILAVMFDSLRKYQGMIASALVPMIVMSMINVPRHSHHGFQIWVLVNTLIIYGLIGLLFGSLIKSLAGKINPILTGAAAYSSIVLAFAIVSIIYRPDDAMAFKDYLINWLELAAIGALSGFAFRLAER